jgi:hypothetical protein
VKSRTSVHAPAENPFRLDFTPFVIEITPFADWGKWPWSLEKMSVMPQTSKWQKEQALP